MEPRVSHVLSRLEARSQKEQAELAALNEKGARFVREAAGRFMLDIGADVGRLLNVLVRSLSARLVLELGGSVGYSTLWLAEAARATGGRVVSFEVDAGKVEQMRVNLSDAGLLSHVEIIAEPAAAFLSKLTDPIDLVLLDHWKALYIEDFDRVFPRVRVGGVVVADNILRPEVTRPEMLAYVAHVKQTPGARSFTLPVGQGIELSQRIA